MSDSVNDDDLSALAAEFVLGTLDPDERTRANVLLEVDEGFRVLVAAWERRLGELHLMVEPVEPDAKLWERIKEKVPQAPPGTELKLPEPPAEAKPPAAPEPAPAERAAAVPDAKPAVAKAEAPALPPAPTIAPKPEPSLTPSVAPALNRAPPPPTPAPAPPVLTPTATRTPQVEARREGADATATRRGGPGAWRAFAVLMTLVVVAMAALLAAWRFVPERVPPVLQPAALMRLVGVPIGTGAAPRPPAPPESQYDE